VVMPPNREAAINWTREGGGAERWGRPSVIGMSKGATIEGGGQWRGEGDGGEIWRQRWATVFGEERRGNREP
jgi:hypothetical protein